MAIQKKHGKGRLDKYYWLAKEKGYRARASFKLIQLNKKYHFLEKSKVLIDLCAAPGSWCQVAAEAMPANSTIIGVDLSPIKPIPRCFTFQSDITTDKCRATIRQHLKSWKADTVLHDGAPNVGTAWVQDAFSQAELVLQSLRLATDFLIEGGTFVTKVFRSKDSTKLEYVFRRLFKHVEHTKPPASRTVSAEIFYVCRGYLAPKRIDPRLLDPRSVFEELADPTPNNEAKVFNPEKKKRKRDGYEEGDWTQFKEVPASQFIQTTDPIAMLGTLNKLTFEQPPNGDIALATLNKLPETTQEIRNCCADLRVLGKKDFRSLLRWRLKVRDIFGFSSKKKKEHQQAEDGEEVAEVESMDEELKIQEELERLKGKEDSKQRKERRKENERKRKQVVRMQLGMTTPMEIGMEQSGPQGDDAMFALKAVDKAGGTSQIIRGRMHTATQVEASESSGSEDGEEFDSDSDGDNLETELDNMYEQYQERKAAQDTNYKAKKARRQHADDEWEGIGSDAAENSDASDNVRLEDIDSDSEDEEPAAPVKLLTDLGTDGKVSGGLTRRAAMFFDQDIFSGIEGIELIDDDSGIDVEEGTSSPVSSKDTSAMEPLAQEQSDSDFEVVNDKPIDDDDDNWEEHPSKQTPQGGRPDIDIITAEAMTLAHQLARGEKTKADLMDDGFNKYSLRDTDGLPEWFLDDENQHSRPQRPITAEAARAIKDKIRAFNARPIKKVREAKERKKYKAAKRLEKMRKKSALLLEDEGMSEADKAKAVQQLMAKAARKKPRKQMTVVVARGGNRGISGRPKGTKGRYKMVDARLKKDMRAQKRLGKKS